MSATLAAGETSCTSPPAREGEHVPLAQRVGLSRSRFGWSPTTRARRQSSSPDPRTDHCAGSHGLRRRESRCVWLVYDVSATMTPSQRVSFEAATTIRRAHERRRLRLRCAAHGPPRLLRRPVRQHEDDRRARRRRSPLLARDQRGALDGPLDDLDRHRDVRAPPRLPALGRPARPVDRDAGFARFSAHGYEVASFVFDTNYLFKDLPEANVLGTSETLDGAFEWLRANRETPFFLYVHNWATHMPYDILHADRKDWLSAKTEIIDGIQSDSASALESMRESYRTAVERQSEVLVASFLEELESLGLRENTVFAFLSDHGESWGERFVGEGRREGRLPHARRDALRRDRRGAVDPLGARTARAGRRLSQVRSVDLMPTLLDLAGLPARETDGESLSLRTSTATARRSSPEPTWARSPSSPSASRRGS